MSYDGSESKRIICSRIVCYNILKMSRRKRPVVINLIKTQLGYAIDSLNKKQRTQTVQFDLQSHLSQSSSIQDPFHINFNAAPKIPVSSIHTTLPITSSWFNLQQIHQIQRQALPEFFGASNQSKDSYKTQDDYYYYRNGIVALWRENNKRYLTSTLCRKNLNGDHCSIIRVHGFLEDWGIINFPSKEYKGFLKKVDPRVQCAVCSNKSLKLYFTDELGELFQICYSCFNEKMYPLKLDAERFRFVDLSQEHLYADNIPWSDDETNKLLLLLERHRHNWSTVSAQFANRSTESLIVHYLKLPFLNVSNFSIFQQGQDIKMPIQTFQKPSIFDDYNNSTQSAAAILYYKYKSKLGDTKKYQRILNTAEIHSQYLADRQEMKIRNLMRFVIDFEMNKLQGKLVCLNQYKKYVEADKKSVENVRKNVIATLLHGMSTGETE